MKRLFGTTLFALLVTLTGCKKDETTVQRSLFTFEFTSSTEGWLGDFADYPNEQNVEAFYELMFSHSVLPSPLNNNEGSLRQSGNNHSDDLFMFIKKKLDGLKPNTSYQVSLEVEIASNVANGSIGVGGSPGEGVYIKAGASTIEPVKVLNSLENHYRMNIDKGNQSQAGKDMKLIGDFANGTSLNIYKLKLLSTSSPIDVMTNANGEIWVIVGTDSGYEATTTIYYDRITVSIKEI